MRKRRFKDISGRVSGKLTAIKRCDDDPYKWECKCACGNFVIIRTNNLNTKEDIGTKSCGCLQKNTISKSKYNKDYLNQKFGSWTAIKRDTKTRQLSWILQCDCGRLKSFSARRIYRNDILKCNNCELIGKKFGLLTAWKTDAKDQFSIICKCKCGNTNAVRKSDLVNSNTKSCGCVGLEIENIPFLKKYGKLTAIKKDLVFKSYWICECDCGKLTSYHRSSLLSGKTTSCGCEAIKKSDLIGQKFGKLTVLKRAKTSLGKTAWECKCECGKKTKVPSGYLKATQAPSCGCLRKKYDGIPMKLRIVYTNMKQRCFNKNLPIYKYYGAKGITIDESWLKDNMLFLKWALKKGWKEGLEIDRRDNYGNYTPQNCRFITKTENLKNRSPWFRKAA